MFVCVGIGHDKRKRQDLRFQLNPCLGHCFACQYLIFFEGLITYLIQKM
ncbi:hypothetical protein RLOC_00009489 [Lonchura striata]|uniref:Uncharacterized protein n=1 Tax=Lonchura striata TaxID=40157 RepID=A0A218UDS9_9PASE|nr:hypothetical protein RLOC_00009489 [Lonchura striata domestica]